VSAHSKSGNGSGVWEWKIFTRRASAVFLGDKAVLKNLRGGNGPGQNQLYGAV
jgi:hypothetical protein